MTLKLGGSKAPPFLGLTPVYTFVSLATSSSDFLGIFFSMTVIVALLILLKEELTVKTAKAKKWRRERNRGNRNWGRTEDRA